MLERSEWQTFAAVAGALCLYASVPFLVRVTDRLKSNCRITQELYGHKTIADISIATSENLATPLDNRRAKDE